MKRKETGSLGEKLAQNFLRKKGYQILENNYRCSKGEIDIVARQKDNLVFVEVRTKSNLDFGIPEESITASKIRHLIMSAESYRQSHPESFQEPWRIDVVAIEMDNEYKLKRIELIENAIEE